MKMASRRRFGAFVYTVATRGLCERRWGRNSVHKWEDRASRRLIGAFVYTVALRGSCERRWGRRSVHRLAKMASRRRFGAFVYTVATWAWVVGGLGIAIVYTNGRIGPLRAVLGHLCTLLGREGRASCNASCIGWHEHPNHHGMPAAPPRWPPLPWSRKQALRDRLCVSGAIVRLVSSQNVNPHKPPRSVTQTREEARKTQRNICRVRFPDGSTLR